VTVTAATASDRVLLDTDVFSFLLKSKGDNAERYRKHVNGKIIAVSFITVGEIYLSLEKTLEGTDRTIAPNDRWIAACALHHRLPLVTNNARHFGGITGLSVITEPQTPTTAPLL
jgi:predicted nucleic acid-binding protein